MSNKKVNLLRRTTCFYPGTIQLPLLKFHSLIDNKKQSCEWSVSRHFYALNIVDFQNKLGSSNSRLQIETDRPYSTQGHHIIISASNKSEEILFYNEVIDWSDNKLTLNQEGNKLTNVKRYVGNSPFTEILILKYYFNINLPSGVNDKPLVEDNDFDILSKAINIYITASNDWTITPPYVLEGALYFESYDIFFDTDVPKEEMQQAFLTKQDSNFDLFHSSGHYKVNPVIREMQVNQQVALGNIFVLSKPDYDKKRAEISSFLTKVRRDIVINRNYKYAFLEIFTFAEAYITEYLTECKLAAGISKSKLKEFEKEIGISYKLNVELPLFLKLDDKDKELIGKINALRKRRNDLIHGNETVEITKDEAINGLNAVHTLILLILSNKKDED